MTHYQGLSGHKAPYTSRWFKTDPIVALQRAVEDLTSRMVVVEDLLADQGDEVGELESRVTALEAGVILQGSFRFIRVDHCLQLQCLVSEVPATWRIIAIWECPEDIVDPP
jgi:hypothetical protein